MILDHFPLVVETFNLLLNSFYRNLYCHLQRNIHLERSQSVKEFAGLDTIWFGRIKRDLIPKELSSYM